jgi:RNA polymerase sigma factor (sigma-70 family)
VLVARYRQFDLCEDAVQEALLAAATQWPSQGVPAEPVGWLVTVARRRLTDLWRSESARRRREEESGFDPPPEVPGVDDSLQVLLMCVHPDLSDASRIALTLRAVGGLTTAEIARAFLVPEATMAQRISRAKATITKGGGVFTVDLRAERLAAALHVRYLIFNEGYTASEGGVLTRVDLCAEAIRLTRMLRRTLPADSEVAGLLALMLLTDSRRETRTDADGHLVPLADQDRSRWDRDQIAEAVALLEEVLPRRELGEYQVQAAIAAVHAEAATDADTDWAQIELLYRLLEGLTGSPVVTLNRAVALGMAAGPQAGLDLLDTVAADPRLARHHRPDAVRAHLLERLGDRDGARECYRRAARATLNRAEQRYLEDRARRVQDGRGAPPSH